MFSDGVLAIAITLLALELRVPSALDLAAAGGFWNALGKNWPSYLAYALSFLRIGVIWINHHDIFRIIRRVDRSVMLLNLLLLLLVCAIPFATDVLAEYLDKSGTESNATILYGLVVLASGVVLNALLIYGVRRPEPLARELAETERRQHLWHSLAGSVVLLAAVGAAFIDVWASLALHAAAAALWLVVAPPTWLGARVAHDFGSGGLRRVSYRQRGRLAPGNAPTRFVGRLKLARSATVTRPRSTMRR